MFIPNKFKLITPFILKKKLNDNYKTIFFKNTANTLAPIRYFPPVNQEWFNSIYAFNINYIKGITILDKMLSRLLKSYFNFHFKNKLL